VRTPGVDRGLAAAPVGPATGRPVDVAGDGSSQPRPRATPTGDGRSATLHRVAGSEPRSTGRTSRAKWTNTPSTIGGKKIPYQPNATAPSTYVRRSSPMLSSPFETYDRTTKLGLTSTKTSVTTKKTTGNRS
jgi:hypothetical protein